MATTTSFSGRTSTWLLIRLSRETTSGRFIPEMDGLRFAAILMVVLYHVNGYLMAKTGSYEPRGEKSDWLCRAALVGSHGVELFFVISGFILALPFAAHYLAGAAPVNLRKYFLRRLTRLEPPYIITLLLLTALTVWFSGSGGSLGPHFAASLFYLHNLIYGTQSKVIGVAWSLEIEVQFYLLVPLLTLVFAIRNAVVRRTLLVTLTLAATAAASRFAPYHPRLVLSLAGYLQFFLVGFLLADIFLLSSEASRKSFYWDAATLAGWPLLFVALQSRVTRLWLFPALVFVLYCAAFRGRVTNRFFSNRWITAIGGMCYSIYLIHYEVISAVARSTKTIGQSLPGPVYLGLQFVLLGLVIVSVCGLYFVFLEKPCMRRDWPQRLWSRARRLFPAREPRPYASFAD
ncbi:MAG TPA: acyltransferase [Terriglobales bacterium]|nr:acyltransferase [Terriglobales bacterium]